MAKIKKLQQNGVDIYPVTHEDAVFDSNGKSISEKINEINSNKADSTDIPTKVSELENDSGFIDKSETFISKSNYCLLSEELAKGGKSITEIIMEKKRVLVDGLFNISDTVILTGSGFDIKGINHGKIVQTTPGLPTIQLGDNGVSFNNSTISDLIIEGNNSTETTKTDSGILVDFAYSVKFENINIYHCGGYGLECKNESSKNGLWIAKFNKCSFSHNYKGGVYFKHSNETQFNDVSFSQCTVQGNGYNIDSNGKCYHPTTKNEAFEDYGDGFSISGVAISIISCDSEGNASAGIRLNTGYKNGITITGCYTEPNYLTSFYISSETINLFCKGNYIAGSTNYKLGSYFVNNNIKKESLVNTQFIDTDNLLNTSNQIRVFDTNETNNRCRMNIRNGFKRNFKLTMKYKSLIETYLSFGIIYRNSTYGYILNTEINKTTLKSNVATIQSIENNIITLNENIDEIDSTWTKLYIHRHRNEFPEYKGNYAYFNSNDTLLVDSANVSISGNVITLSDLSKTDLNKIQNCTHVTLQKPITKGSQSVFNYIKIPTSIDKYNTLVYYDSSLENSNYEDTEYIFDIIDIWGVPYSYNNAKHIAEYLKIEQTDTVYIKSTELNNIKNKYNNMLIYTTDTHEYIIYYNGNYYKTPTKVSELENDSEFTTKTEVGEEINNALTSVDNALNTEDKTIVGAINELDSEVFDIAANVISLDNYKLDKTDERLTTENKDIVAAINEIKEATKSIDALTLNGYSLWVGTTSELNAVVNRDPNTLYFEIDDGTGEEVVSVPIVDGVLSLTADKYQKTNMVSGTAIEFPSVTKFTEIHLYFDAEIDMELNFPDCKWRVEPNIEAGKSYEVVCTYNTINWLVNVMVYS